MGVVVDDQVLLGPMAVLVDPGFLEPMVALLDPVLAARPVQLVLVGMPVE